MIKSFRHAGIEEFFKTGSKAGIKPEHATRLERRLTALNVAKGPSDVDLPGWDLHPLKGDLVSHYAIKVNGNWRLTFTFDNNDVILVDYKDYH